MDAPPVSPTVQLLRSAETNEAKVQLSVLRLDQIQPEPSGNKWYKLKYNILQAQQEGHQKLLTFGGAYSNHIYATAAAGRHFGFSTIGIIRGERVEPLNPTLKFAEEQGMQLHFVSREDYRRKAKTHFINRLHQQFGEFYLIPEGGTNLLAVQGCAEILPDSPEFDIVCCSAGTGGTLAGLLAGLAGQKQVLGFPALKGGDFLRSDIDRLTQAYCGQQFTNYRLITDYHFGGYARADKLLIDFMNEFYRKHRLLLDPIYTAKMMYGLFSLIEQGYFPAGTRLLAIHTGGLQGIDGFNQRYKTKNLRIFRS
jgi:1-aminocyclopropane-1-carboxylate deaminase/D-cysteine desulfhydrase-like pyridoxal-dependent ACC family enzyme